MSKLFKIIPFKIKPRVEGSTLERNAFYQVSGRLSNKQIMRFAEKGKIKKRKS